MAGSEDQQKAHDDQKLAASWFRQYTLVLEFLGAVALLGYAGHRLDLHYGWQSWGLLGGLLSGTAVGLYRMIRESR
ncbi:MAG: hypothetical protein GY842_20830 [bacterium]|nr:hypothetical protein [bacterium]